MEGYIKPVRTDLIRSVYEHPEKWLLKYKEYGKSDNIKDYSREEVTEMLYGAYPHKGYLLVDGDYFINVKDVIQAGCTLKDVTVDRKSDLFHSTPINRIRTLYVENYYLITNDCVNGVNKHSINSYLSKVKAIHHGRGRFHRLYSISNTYKSDLSFSNGDVPKDLFHPIKIYFNGVFFDDQYRVDNFSVDTDLKISF